MPKYEALIKITDNVNPNAENQGALYKSGDIVVIRELGWNWGRREVLEFLIVPLTLTEEEAVALVQPVLVEWEDQMTPEEIEEVRMTRRAENLIAAEPLTDRDIQELVQPIQQRLIKRRRFRLDIDEVVAHDANCSIDVHQIEQKANPGGQRERMFDMETEEQPIKGKRCQKHHIEDTTSPDHPVSDKIDRQITAYKAGLLMEKPRRRFIQREGPPVPHIKNLKTHKASREVL